MKPSSITEWIKTCFAAFTSPFNQLSATGSALPKQLHRTIPSAHLQKRLIVIGDVHGCLDELLSLLKKLNYSPENATVILVGDTMVKGPKSVETIRWLKAQPNILCMRGNHEDNVLLSYMDGTSKHALKPEFKFVQQLDQSDFDFIKELPVSIAVPSMQLLVVHAGIDPRIGTISDQKIKHLIRMRCIDPTGEPTKDNPVEGKNTLWASVYKGPPYVVFGHDAKRGLQVHPWARGLDTGCVYGKQLSALVVDDTSKNDWWNSTYIVSVDAEKVYYVRDDD